MLVQIESATDALREKRPDSPDFHLFETDSGSHLFLVNGSRLYSIPPDVAAALRADRLPAEEILASYRLAAPPYIEDAPLSGPPLRAISLAIAEACNLGCVYCYAQQGSFGRKAQMMERERALGAIDLLFQSANRGDRVQITFLGGEPLANRILLRESTEHAVRLAESTGIAVGFAITTNGTLVLPEDCEFLERHGFAVTISLDGTGRVHDRLRPFADGSGSYNRIIARICPLLERQSRMQVSARVTVTPANLELRETLDALIGMGFRSVGFSPMLSSPNHSQEMTPATLNAMLRAMIQCGEAFESHLDQNEKYPFFNLMTALNEIHKGTHRPYPCGAGAGYFGVSADGDLYACHRFVNDPEGKLGSVANGIDRAGQDRWLAARHVHAQEPCRSCWARYLCGGGCHYEVLRRGRPACDFIRGWLDYCLQAYIRILEKRPEYFFPE